MPGVTRRQLLVLAAAGGAAVPLVGCTFSSPVVRGGPTAPPPRPSPTPVPGTRSGSDREAALAAVAGRRAAEEGGRAATRWRRLAAGHAEHALVLHQPDPTAPLPTPAPSPSPGPDPAPDAGWAELAEDAAGEHRRAALGAAGPLALLWASLAAFAAAAGGAESVAGQTARPQPAAPVTDLVAMADVVVALNQAAHAYELALVPLALGGDARAAAEDRLQRLLALRDAVSRVLAERGRAVPAAEPGYDVELDPDDGAGSAALRRRVETGLLPWLGRWVQASGEAERRLAVDALVAATRSGTRLGAELAVWPGW